MVSQRLPSRPDMRDSVGVWFPSLYPAQVLESSSDGSGPYGIVSWRGKAGPSWHSVLWLSHQRCVRDPRGGILFLATVLKVQTSMNLRLPVVSSWPRVDSMILDSSYRSPYQVCRIEVVCLPEVEEGSAVHSAISCWQTSRMAMHNAYFDSRTRFTLLLDRAK